MISLNSRFRGQRMSGVQRFATEIADALAALAAAGEAPPLRALAPGGAVWGRLPGQLWEQLALPWQARGTLLLGLGNTGPLALGRAQAVVIHDAGAFDTPESYAPAFRLWYRFLHRALAWRGARLLTVSAFSQGRIAEALDIPPARIGVVPEGGEHILRATAEPAILARHGLVPGRYALAVGNPAAHKNLDALQAATEVLAAHGMVLALAGAADARVFQATATGPAAIALGRVTDAELRALYQAALCLIFPSRYEGFGLPPLEAMCCGCPVLAAAAGAVPEVCADAALWFDPADPATLATALAHLIEDPSLPISLRAAGLARAAHYSWPAAARALLRQLPAPSGMAAA